MKNKNSEIEAIAKKLMKGKKKPTPKKPTEPQTAAEWLRKAYIDADPADGAPKVGDIGYV
jgi:hypothetical protein